MFIALSSNPITPGETRVARDSTCAGMGTQTLARARARARVHWTGARGGRAITRGGLPLASSYQSFANRHQISGPGRVAGGGLLGYGGAGAAPAAAGGGRDYSDGSRQWSRAARTGTGLVELVRHAEPCPLRAR